MYVHYRIVGMFIGVNALVCIIMMTVQLASQYVPPRHIQYAFKLHCGRALHMHKYRILCCVCMCVRVFANSKHTPAARQKFSASSHHTTTCVRNFYSRPTIICHGHNVGGWLNAWHRGWKWSMRFVARRSAPEPTTFILFVDCECIGRYIGEVWTNKHTRENGHVLCGNSVQSINSVVIRNTETSQVNKQRKFWMYI